MTSDFKRDNWRCSSDTHWIALNFHCRAPDFASSQSFTRLRSRRACTPNYILLNVCTHKCYTFQLSPRHKSTEIWRITLDTCTDDQTFKMTSNFAHEQSGDRRRRLTKIIEGTRATYFPIAAISVVAFSAFYFAISAQSLSRRVHSQALRVLRDTHLQMLNIPAAAAS